MCNNTQKKKAAGAGKDFTLFFGVMLHFNFKCEGMFILKSFYLKASCYLRLPDCSNPGSLTSARTREKFELTETGRIL